MGRYTLPKQKKEVTKKMYCKNCGKQIETNFNFCNQCGHLLAEPENTTKLSSYPQTNTKKKKTNNQLKKIIPISVAIIVVFIIVIAVMLKFVNFNNKSLSPSISSTTIHSAQESTSVSISETPSKDVIFDALKYNSSSTLNEIMSLYPGGQLEDGIYFTDTSADLKRYLYKNFCFNFADEKLQSIFIDYKYALYTNESNCPGETYKCNSTDEFLPLFGLSGGQISDSDNLYIADNCGIYKFICFHNGSNIENVEICYTDLILYYN